MKSEMILLVEDDLSLAREITQHLREFGFQVDHASDGREGLRRCGSGKYVLVVLDVKLPGMNGFDICRELRATHPLLPILFLTSCSSEIDRVLGFELGADDYIEKPVSIHELVVRIRNKLRRQSRAVEESERQQAADRNTVITAGPFIIDPVRRTLQKSGQPIKLTTKEFDLVLFFAQNPETVFSKADLLNAVWDVDTLGYEDAVVSMIRRLRKKIEDDPDNPLYVRTMWGSGYSFVPVPQTVPPTAPE